MNPEHEGRKYLRTIHDLRSALSREMDAVQEGRPPTGTVAQAMVRMIDQRAEYERALRVKSEGSS